LTPTSEEEAQVRAMCALNAKVGLLEMTGHEFLDGSFRRQKFTYADGTTVTIDLDKGEYQIAKALK